MIELIVVMMHIISSGDSMFSIFQVPLLHGT